MRHLFQRDPSGGPLLATVLLAALLLTAIALWSFFAEEKIVADGAWVRKVNLIGQQHSFPRAQIGGMAVYSVHFGHATSRQSLAVIFGRDRRSLFTLWCAYWDSADLDRLAAALEGYVPHQQDNISARDLQRRHPGALPIFYRHVWLTAWVALAILIGGALILQALLSHSS